MTREMKNSGIDWIGQIPADWRVENLQWNMTEIIEKNSPIKMTSVLSLTKEKGVIPYEDKGNQGNKSKESIEEYKIAYKDTIVANSMNILIGSVGISNYDGCVSPVYYVFKNNEKTDLRYLNYIFTTEQFQKQLRKYANGILEIRLRVSSENIMKQKVMFPDLAEQKKIADFLDSKISEIDKMIAETKSSIENYKEYKQSVITEAVTKGLNKNVQMKDSGIDWIGEIPTHYRLAKFSRVITNTMNGLTRRDLDASIGEIVLRLKNIGIGKIDYSDLNRITLSESEKRTYALNDGDFLFVRVNGSKELVGKCAIYEDFGETVAFNDHIIRVEFNKKLVDKQFVLWYLQSKNCKFDISHHIKTSAGQYTISSDGIKDLRLIYSPLEEQKEISEYLNNKCAEIDNLIFEKEALVSNLGEYKKSLIYEYVTGKKEVSTAKNDEAVIVTPIYPAVYQAKSKRFAQAVLMCRVLDTSKHNKGRVKLEKTLYTIENHIGFDFDTKYTRDAAGPLDKSIYDCEGIISRRNKWFKISTSKHGVSYTATKDVNKYKNYYNNYFADYNAEIERIIRIFDDFSTDQAEIIATLYGAWNDFIIDNKPFTDDDVVNEVLNNWHDSKKRFSKDIWLRAMEKMRTLDLVPKGYGKKTISKEV